MSDPDDADPTAPLDSGRRAWARLLAAAGGGALLGLAERPGAALAQPLLPPPVTGLRVVATLAALRALPGANADDTAAVMALGAAAPHDGGGGLFAWARDASVDAAMDDGGTLVVPAGPGAPGGCWRRVFGGAIDVRWFAAMRTGGDWTRALRAAVRAAVRAGPDGPSRAVHLPGGNYVVTGTVQIPDAGLHVWGDGPIATNVQFQPGRAGEHVLFDLTARDTRRGCDPSTLLWPDAENPGRLVAASVRHLSCSSVAGDPATKIAVRVNDGDGVVVDDVRVHTLWTTGGTFWHHADPPSRLPNPSGLPRAASVGVEVLGGQLCVLSNVYAHADAPIRVGPAAIDRGRASGTGAMCDHLRLTGVHLTPHPSEAGLRVLPGVVVTNLLLDGDNSVSGGSYGVHWDRGDASMYPGLAPGAAVAHANVSLNNLRVETLVGHADRAALPPHAARRRSVHLTAGDGRNTLYNLSLTNVSCAVAFAGTGAGADPDGLFVRHAEYVTMTACTFPSSHPATRHLDIDDTCSEVDWRNCRFESQGAATNDPASATATGVDHRLVGVSLGGRASLSAPSLLPSSANFVRTSGGQHALDRAVGEFGVWVIRYRGVVETGPARAFRLIALAGWTHKFGQISLVARDRGTDAVEAGAWAFSRATLQTLHRTANTADGGTVPAGKIGLRVVGENEFSLVNNLARAVDFTVTVEFRAVVDAVDPRTGRGYEIP